MAAVLGDESYIDAVVAAIGSGELHRDNISFDLLRRRHAADRDLRDRLEWGKAILTSQAELDNYLYSYGPMTRRQWGAFLERVTLPQGRLQIIDYGCGQGLACALLFDYFGRELVDRVDRVVLIEPSAVALHRAQAIVTCYLAGTREIACINKTLDELLPDELLPIEGRATIHLFSNILDIDDFEEKSLFEKMFRTRGLHRVLAVSHHRYFDGGSERIEGLAKDVSDPANWDGEVELRSECVRFDLDDGKPAISWDLAAMVRYDSP